MSSLFSRPLSIFNFFRKSRAAEEEAKAQQQEEQEVAIDKSVRNFYLFFGGATYLSDVFIIRISIKISDLLYFP